MVAIAAKKKAAIVLTEEEKLHLTNIVRLSDNDAAIKRANILLSIASGETIRATAKICQVSAQVTSIVKKQWSSSELSGHQKINAVCFSSVGRRKNTKAMEEKESNVLEFNRRLNQDAPRNTRSRAIAEMAKEEGIKLSVSTVNRFLKQYESRQAANV